LQRSPHRRSGKKDQLDAPTTIGPERTLVRQRRRWLVVAASVILLGTAGSVLSAGAIAAGDRRQAERNASTSATEISAALMQNIQHEQDLVDLAGAFVNGDPQFSQANFTGWGDAAQIFKRYPELEAIGAIMYVPAGELARFESVQTLVPPASPGGNGSYELSPPGVRPFYCLSAMALVRGGQQWSPPGYDFCTGPLRSSLLGAETTGKSSYVPVKTATGTDLALGTPIYRGGSVPPTVAGRRAMLVGWTGAEIRPDVILKDALSGHPGTRIAFHYSSGVTFASGAHAPGARTTTLELSNGWRVQVFTPAGGVGTTSNALFVLIGGFMISVLVGLVIYLLGAGRSRALLMVRERTEEINHQAFHDSLTGLPNRALILDRIDQMVRRSRREHTSVAVLFLDLDDFKFVNDTLGHTVGDRLLIAVGARLSGILRGHDSVGRLGGDEFVVLVEANSGPPDAEMVATRIVRALEAPFEIAGSDTPVTVTASIGIVKCGDEPAEALLQKADIALYGAKAAGKKGSLVFSPSMKADLDNHRRLEIDLHGALEAGQFFLLYQPTVSLSTGAVTGVEALLRWRHPVRGVVQPDQFIPMLESSGLIVAVGRWVLETACRQSILWHRPGRQFTVAVNLSAVQLENDQIVDHVRSAMSTGDFDPELLTLELTESALMRDPESTGTVLARLKSLGVRLAIDDFGTGYSSLAYLRQFPIDVLKIDQSFVAEIGDSEESTAIVHTLVQLGKLLGLETIAEGVETPGQLRRLTDEQVDTGQGFLFARPLDVGAVDRLIMEDPNYLGMITAPR
jgi:diguanylate cyclase (GGDEF)-like protein